MVKVSDIELPVVFKHQLLFKSGSWNRWHITPDEVNRSVSNTSWNRFNKSLIFSHKDKNPNEFAESYQGSIENIQPDGKGSVYGDVHIWDLNTAVKTLHGDAPMAISAGISWPDKFDQPTNFFYRNFSLITDPGVKSEGIYLRANFAEDNEKIEGFKTANFSAVIDSTSSEGSPVTQHTNELTTKDTVGKKKKKNADGTDSDEDEEDDKKEVAKESKEHPTLPKSTVEQIVEDHEKKKEADYSNKQNIVQEVINAIPKDTPQPTKGMMTDVLTGKAQNMEGSNPNTNKEDATHIKSNERGLQENKSMNKEDNATSKDPSASFEARLSVIEHSLKSSKADFEATSTPVVETKPTEVTKVETPVVPSVPTESMKSANPVVDDNFVDKVVSKVSEKLLPALRPAPRTTAEMGSRTVDSTEDAIDRIINGFKTNNG